MIDNGGYDGNSPGYVFNSTPSRTAEYLFVSIFEKCFLLNHTTNSLKAVSDPNAVDFLLCSTNYCTHISGLREFAYPDMPTKPVANQNRGHKMKSKLRYNDTETLISA